MVKPKKDLGKELGEELQRGGTLNVLHTNAIADKIGLSATEFEALDIITHHQPVSAGKLAMYCGLTTGAITGLVDRLERAGFVQRHRDTNDRRRVLLEHIHTPEIEEKVRQLYRPLVDGYKKITNPYTSEQMEFLIQHNKKVNDMLENIITELQKK
jgi:DNA-binding MarR family transcriptional regulator